MHLPCLSSREVNLARSPGLPAGGAGHECTDRGRRGTKACSRGIPDPRTTAPLLCLSGAGLGTKEVMEPFKV